MWSFWDQNSGIDGITANPFLVSSTLSTSGRESECVCDGEALMREMTMEKQPLSVAVQRNESLLQCARVIPSSKNVRHEVLSRGGPHTEGLLYT